MPPHGGLSGSLGQWGPTSQSEAVGETADVRTEAISGGGAGTGNLSGGGIA